MNKLESLNFFKGNKNQDYENLQIIRHNLKLRNKQNPDSYKSIAKALSQVIASSKSANMVCLGTRNNHERDCFAEFMPGTNVKSLDISSSSDADYIMDFTKFPPDWIEKWDIIYSNSIDHSYDATSTLNIWIDILKIEGILALDLQYDCSVSETDICAFERNNVFKYLSNLNRIEILNEVPGLTNTSSTWILKKLVK